ncbi:MAG: carbohydrate kinase [Bacteroidetes bacterium]|nr:MAG: carbohydrate kinase [Bacteroidota bacterium]
MTLVSKEMFDRFNDLKVMIVGDVMIDRYLTGHVDRISPEAPVPIVLQHSRDNRLGGAANVGLNVSAMGAKVFLCSVIGADENADIFSELLANRHLTSEGILKSTARRTTVKTRVMAGSQQLLRVDQEDSFDLSDQEEEMLLERIEAILKAEKIDVIIFQDYNKGVLTSGVIEGVINKSKQLAIPTAVDPKFKNFWAYNGVTMFKPNLREIRDQCGFEIDTTIESLDHASAYVKKQLNNQISLITLSEKGLYISNGQKSQIIPTKVRGLVDVCGAGDSVISLAALGLALGLDMELIADLSNHAGGQVCEKNGVVPVDKDQLLAAFVSVK